MTHSFRLSDTFGINESGINPLIQDSPVVRNRYSRFARQAESFNQSKLSQSMMYETFSQPSTLHESSLSGVNSTLQNQTIGTDFINVSDVNSAINMNLSSAIQLPIDNVKADEPAEDDMSKLQIFQSFFELNQCMQNPKPIESFELVEQFFKTCDENLQFAKESLESKTRTNSEAAYFKKYSSLIRLERNTWQLLRILYHDRLVDQADQDRFNMNSDVDEMEIEEDMRLRLTDHELATRTLNRNIMLREMNKVILWLEDVYENDMEGQDNVEFYSDGPMYWENTLHALKNASHNFNASTLGLFQGRQLCDKMDPDASIRSGMPLHDLDKEDENRLFHYMFKLIRGGQPGVAQEIAERLGYYWLSAALDGWKLNHDPNYNPEDIEDEESVPSPGTLQSKSAAMKTLQPISGNPYRDLWKYTAWMNSKIEGTNLYERAIFAVFSGNRSILMPLCTSWMDKLWAYFKCSLDVHIESLLIDSNIPKPDMRTRSNIELPDSYWDNKLSPHEIFRELSSQSSVSLSGFQSLLEEEYHQQVERCLILGKIDELIDHLFEWSKTIQASREARFKQELTEKNSFNVFNTSLQAKNQAKEEEMAKVVEPNLLRFFAHLVIMLRNLQLIVDEKQGELCNEVLEVYIGFLIEHKLVELVAFYTQFLPENRQVKMFATLLEGIEEDDYRRLCIKIAKNTRINLTAAIILVVENIRMGNLSYQSLSLASAEPQTAKKEKTSLLKKIQLTSTVTQEDLRKISSLEWLLLDADTPQFMELLWQANALIRSFLLDQKVDQAREAFSKLPEDIITQTYQEFKRAMSNGSTNVLLSFDMANVIREYFCLKSFFEANEAFHKWQHYFYNARPREPVQPKVMNRLSERVAHEQIVKQYERDLEIYQQHVQTQSVKAADKINAFLCFPEGIWLNAEEFDMEEFGEVSELQSNFGGASSLGGASVAATPTIRLETEITEVVGEEEEDDGVGSINSDVEIASSDLRGGADHNAVLRMQRERKEADWELRTVQLDAMRRIYVPQLVSLLMSVYADSGNLQECVRVADIVADEQHRLHATFTREQLVDLLNKIRETCIEILTQVPDPLGYVS